MIVIWAAQVWSRLVRISSDGRLWVEYGPSREALPQLRPRPVGTSVPRPRSGRDRRQPTSGIRSGYTWASATLTFEPLSIANGITDRRRGCRWQNRSSPSLRAHPKDASGGRYRALSILGMLRAPDDRIIQAPQEPPHVQRRAPPNLAKIPTCSTMWRCGGSVNHAFRNGFEWFKKVRIGDMKRLLSKRLKWWKP